MEYDSTVAKELFDKGFVRVPFSKAQDVNIEQLFRNFLKRRNNLKDWCFDYDGLGDPDDGIILRNGKSGDDRKLIYHWRPRLARLIEENNTVVSNEDLDFFEVCREVYVLCEETLFGVAKALDKLHKAPFSFVEELRLAIIYPRPSAAHVLRLLSYKVQNRTKIGKDHFDRSLLTLMTAQNGGRIYYLDENDGNTKKYINLEKDEALIFFGLKTTILSGEKISALYHGVDIESPEERFSMAYFAHTINVKIASTR